MTNDTSMRARSPAAHTGIAALERARTLARLLDRAVTIPGTRFGIGLDGVLGLIPGVGDAVGGLASVYLLYLGYRAGAPASVLTRMAANVCLDSLIGGIPVLGDVFDFGYKANLRNVALLERSIADPQRARRAGRTFVVGVIALLVLLVLGVVAVVVLLLRALAAIF